VLLQLAEFVGSRDSWRLHLLRIPRCFNGSTMATVSGHLPYIDTSQPTAGVFPSRMPPLTNSAISIALQTVSIAAIVGIHIAQFRNQISPV
jgi:hypothetical protein